jgi:rod shape-determining protein MreC
MEYSPPPLFRQGPSAAARLVFFASVAIALMLVDTRLHVLERVRQAVAVVIYPLQAAARAPGDMVSGFAKFFVSQAQVTSENTRLKAVNTEAQASALRARQVESENAHLRRLLDTREALEVKSLAAQVLYDARDVFSRKVILDKGLQAGVVAGQIVVDEGGVLGQITRVQPLTSEATLVTDKDQAVPIQIVRNGLRGVVYGSGAGPTLELRFMTANADVQENDVLVTSGLDGVYLPGLPVAKVSRIEREAGYAFARITCTPAAGVSRYSHVLVLSPERKGTPPPPLPEDEGKAKRGKRKFEERQNALEAAKGSASGNAAGKDAPPATPSPTTPTTTPAAPQPPDTKGASK